MKTTVYIATSMDGFIAREDGGLDWLSGHAEESAAGGEDYGYKAFMATVDALVMGRNTYETVLSFGGWPYEDKAVIVLSSRNLEIPERLAGTVTAMSGTPQEIVDRLAARGMRHLYIDGGHTVQRFLEAGLINKFIITRIPVLIGRGIPLFGPLRHDVRLRHLETISWKTGLVQSHYEVITGT